jgi:predicted transcriptional regulator of viral defense system
VAAISSDLRRTVPAMDDRMDAIARRQHGLITRRQALELGLSDHAIQHRLRIGTWLRVARGVYRFAGVPPTSVMELLAGLLSIGGSAAACRSSAAALFGLPGFSIRPFHALVPIDAQSRVPGIRVHRTKCFDLGMTTTVDGVPVTTIRRTLFDLCGTVSFGRAERAVDHALSRRLVAPSELGEVFDRLARRGRPGSAGMRAILEDRGIVDGPGPESELERRFLALCRSADLPMPELQVDVGSDGAWIARVDCLFRATCVVVELDGATFHTSLSDRRADAVRDAALERAGFSVLRFTWNEVVGHPADVLERLAAALDLRVDPNFVHLPRLQP